MTQATITTVTRRFIAVHNQHVGEQLLAGQVLADECCVGDLVKLGSTVETQITKILPRKNILLRQHYQRKKLLCANVDYLFVISGPGNLLQTEFIDRVLCTSLAQEIPVAIIANKQDLEPGYDRQFQCYREIGIPVFGTSFKSGEGIDDLRKFLEEIQASIITFTGLSGVGKSSILNLLFEQQMTDTAEVSKRRGTGRQTTTQARAHFHAPLKMYIVDLPGVQQFGLHHLSQAQILGGFPEFQDYRCEFDNCSHVRERECSVRVNVESGEITASRYESYKKFFNEYERFARTYSK